jgi:hypothetical protein
MPRYSAISSCCILTHMTLGLESPPIMCRNSPKSVQKQKLSLGNGVGAFNRYNGTDRLRKSGLVQVQPNSSKLTRLYDQEQHVPKRSRVSQAARLPRGNLTMPQSIRGYWKHGAACGVHVFTLHIATTSFALRLDSRSWRRVPLLLPTGSPLVKRSWSEAATNRLHVFRRSRLSPSTVSTA